VNIFTALGKLENTHLWSGDVEFPSYDEVEQWIVGNDGNGYPDADSFDEVLKIISRNEDGSFDFHVTNGECTRHIGHYPDTEEDHAHLLRDVGLVDDKLPSTVTDADSAKVYIQYPNGFQTIEQCHATPDNRETFIS